MCQALLAKLTATGQNSTSSVDIRCARPYWRNSQRQDKTQQAAWTYDVPGLTGETHSDRTKLNKQRGHTMYKFRDCVSRGVAHNWQKTPTHPAPPLPPLPPSLGPQRYATNPKIFYGWPRCFTGRSGAKKRWKSGNVPFSVLFASL